MKTTVAIILLFVEIKGEKLTSPVLEKQNTINQ